MGVQSTAHVHVLKIWLFVGKKNSHATTKKKSPFLFSGLGAGKSLLFAIGLVRPIHNRAMTQRIADGSEEGGTLPTACRKCISPLNYSLNGISHRKLF